MLVAFDFGLTNTDVVITKFDENQFHSFPTMEINEEFISHIFDSINIKVSQVSKIAVPHGVLHGGRRVAGGRWEEARGGSIESHLEKRKTLRYCVAAWSSQETSSSQ